MMIFILFLSYYNHAGVPENGLKIVFFIKGGSVGDGFNATSSNNHMHDIMLPVHVPTKVNYLNDHTIITQ